MNKKGCSQATASMLVSHPHSRINTADTTVSIIPSFRICLSLSSLDFPLLSAILATSSYHFAAIMALSGGNSNKLESDFVQTCAFSETAFDILSLPPIMF
jgi:hypothetical protein